MDRKRVNEFGFAAEDVDPTLASSSSEETALLLKEEEEKDDKKTK